MAQFKIVGFIDGSVAVRQNELVHVANLGNALLHMIRGDDTVVIFKGKRKVVDWNDISKI